MNNPLPNAKDLEKLPLRAIAAYAARATRRYSKVLRGVISDNVIDNALSHIDLVVRTPFLSDVDESLLYRAVADLFGELSTVKPICVNAHRAGLCISRCAGVASSVVNAWLEPLRADYYMRRAAEKAEKVVCRIDEMDNEMTAARELAYNDFELLVKTYGLHDEVVIGDPVDCFFEEETEKE